MPHRLKASGLGGRRRQRQNIEYLETRRLLNAAPVVPEPPAAVWDAALRTVDRFEATHFAAFEAPIEYSSPHAVIAEGAFARDPAMTDFVTGPPHSTRVVAFDELAGAAFAEPPELEVIFLLTPPFPDAGSPFVPKPFREPPDAPASTEGTLTHSDFFEASSANTSTGGQVSPSSLWTAEPHGFDAEFEHAVILVENGWQPGAFGIFAGPDVTLVEAHPRVAELLRDPPGEVRLAMSPADGIRFSNGALAYFDSAADVERHSTIGFGVVIGQSARGEAAAIGGSAIGGVLPNGSWAYGEDAGPVEAAQRGAAWHLVALHEALHSANVGVSSAAVQAAQRGAQQAMSLLVREVLAPNFALDAAALTVAMNDFAAQADELGAGLLEILSPVASGEAALVAGVLGAGLAYRHWCGSRCDRRSEEQDLLSSRFIRGHASIRIGGSS